MLLKFQVKLTFLRPKRMRVCSIYVIKYFEYQPKKIPETVRKRLNIIGGSQKIAVYMRKKGTKIYG